MCDMCDVSAEAMCVLQCHALAFINTVDCTLVGLQPWKRPRLIDCCVCFLQVASGRQ
jgi:hypothetical protein